MNIEMAKAIHALSSRINEMGYRLDSFFVQRTDDNKKSAEDAQNATCDLSIELEERIADIENALCELSGGQEEDLEDG